jgi:hypothetical protein
VYRGAGGGGVPLLLETPKKALVHCTKPTFSTEKALVHCTKPPPRSRNHGSAPVTAMTV